mmetsp:Transcript_418/g.1462  ORF Transcript_418/g.1462 Transcript_418/m.1462 type:complete len:447 (-) Transcript_418:185-1525(-)
MADHPAPPVQTGVELANEGRVHEHLYHIGRGVVVGITKRRAWMMVFTVVACTAVFIAEMAVNDCPGHQCSSNLQEGTSKNCVLEAVLGPLSFEPLDINPLFGPRADTLVFMGGLNTDLIVREGQGWRLMTSMWLHGGVVHLVINLFCIWRVGSYLNNDFGHVQIAVLYLAAGLGGALASAVFLAGTVSVGASGSLFGLLGALISELIINWHYHEKPIRQLIFFVVAVVVNLLLGLMPFIDNFAHLGGFVIGFLLGFILLIRPMYKIQWLYQHNNREATNARMSQLEEQLQQSREEEAENDDIDGEDGHVTVQRRLLRTGVKKWQAVLSVLAVLLTGLYFVAFFILLYSNTDGHEVCSWCKYLNCVDFGWWECQTASDGEVVIQCTVPTSEDCTEATEVNFDLILQSANRGILESNQFRYSATEVNDWICINDAEATEACVQQCVEA